jgi:hypothetical protein
MNERHAPRKRLLTTIGFGIIWCLALGAGLRSLLSYDSTPGSVGALHQRWPAGTKIPAPNERPTLLMLAHPQCPCTRASIDELAKVMARVQGKVSAYVLFLKPTSAPVDWEKTELRRSAAAIPGVTVLSDVDGTEAQKFGAETSGHTFLYDRTGELLFSGGITQSRGHAGDNAGENAIVALLDHQQPFLARTFVYGCSLVERMKKNGDAPCPR